MNNKLLQIVRRLERQGYQFSFDDSTPDADVEATLDIVFADFDDDFEHACDGCGRHVTTPFDRDDPAQR